jgi:succinate dehydrogenase/fumarate reductase cytochrome b subunit
MFWDAGRGLELPQVHISGWLVVIFSVILTVLSWSAGYGMLGGA